MTARRHRAAFHDMAVIDEISATKTIQGLAALMEGVEFNGERGDTLT